MKHLGCIHIENNKVIFVFHELEKPNYKREDILGEKWYIGAIQEYQASKREVEVKNVMTVYDWPDEIYNPNDDKIYGYYFTLDKPNKEGNTAIGIEHNQPCEAEVTDNKATITKIL